jgi:Matrixin
MLLRLRPLPAFAAAFLAISAPGRALDIQFDYTYDTATFFIGHPERQSLLDAAAAVFELRFTDTLTAISPSGGNTWSADFDHPGTGAPLSVSNLLLAQGVLKVYVGAMQLGTSTLGMGGPGGYHVAGSGPSAQAWFDTVEARGQVGALAMAPTDFGPWGGSLTFDIDANWYFGTGSLSGKNDFLSVATHEMGHLLGIGTANSWYEKISGGNFTGAASTAANGGIQAGISGSGHWASGTMSTIFGTTTAQEVAMDPSITVGTQKYFTTLDFAGMQDIGWTLVPEPSSTALLAASSLLMFLLPRRRVKRAA